MFDFSAARTNMVDSQIHTAGVIIPAVLEAFGTTPRELFVPENVRTIAYADEDIPVGNDRFLIEPVVHARMVQAAEPKPEDVALDIGGATGYSATILSSMVTTVIALEEDEACLERATKLWSEMGADNVAGVHGRLTEGNADNAPFNLIFVNGAVSEIPQTLVDQLAPGGRMVTILKEPGATMGQVTLIQKTGSQDLGKKGFSSYTVFESGGAYLPGFEPQPAFNF